MATSLGRMCVYFANTGYQFQPSFGAINGAAPETPPWALVGLFPLAKETSPEAKASGAGPAPDASEEAAPREVSPAKGWRPAEEVAPREVSLA